MSILYRHRKTGGLYTLLFEAILEKNLERVVVYRCTETGKLWVRPYKEFFDGRFELLL